MDATEIIGIMAASRDAQSVPLRRRRDGFLNMGKCDLLIM